MAANLVTIMLLCLCCYDYVHMIISRLFQQQQLSINQVEVTVIFNGDLQPFLRNTTNEK